MSNILRLNYSVENETAETAIKSFALILQKAYEQHRKLWNKYLDLVKKCGVDSSVHNEIQEAWKEKNVLRTRHTFPEDTKILNKSADQENPSFIKEEIQNRKESQSFIDNISESSLFDLMDVNDTIYQFQPKTTNVILPESPIFMRREEKSGNSTSEISRNNENTSILNKTETDNKSDYNKQSTSKNTFCITIPEKNLDDISFDNLSPFIIQSTPVINNKFNKKNRRKLFKKACQQQSDDEVSSKKKQPKKSKIPLQALDNIANPLSTYLIHDNSDQTNNKIDNNKSTFYNTKKNVNTTVLSNNENVLITRFRKSLFNRELSTEDTITENKTATDEKINNIYLDDANDKNETIFEDIIANSQDNQKVQLQNKNQLKLKRKSKMTNTIKASSSTNNSIQMQNIVCPTKKRNIAINDNSILSSKMDNDSTKKNSLIFSKDIELEKKLVNKNNSERFAYIKQKESNELNEFQSIFGNETYFEEKSPEKNTSCVNKVINKNSLRLENMQIDAVKCNNINKSAKKDIEMKNKKGWSCWECDEYYKTEAGISDTQMQRRKNQCSRHKNEYYARNATPPGFWDPFLPSIASDSP